MQKKKTTTKTLKGEDPEPDQPAAEVKGMIPYPCCPKGFYAGDVANTFSVPVETHREETEFKQMDGYVSIGMLNGLREETDTDQTTDEEERDLSEKVEQQEAKGETVTQTDLPYENENSERPDL